MPYKYFFDFMKSLVLNAEQKAMYLMQIENNWDSMSGKIPRKNNFYDFDKPTDQPTNQPTNQPYDSAENLQVLLVIPPLNRLQTRPHDA